AVRLGEVSGRIGRREDRAIAGRVSGIQTARIRRKRLKIVDGAVSDPQRYRCVWIVCRRDTNQLRAGPYELPTRSALVALDQHSAKCVPLPLALVVRIGHRTGSAERIPGELLVAIGLRTGTVPVRDCRTDQGLESICAIDRCGERRGTANDFDK